MCTNIVRTFYRVIFTHTRSWRAHACVCVTDDLYDLYDHHHLQHTRHSLLVFFVPALYSRAGCSVAAFVVWCVHTHTHTREGQDLGTRACVCVWPHVLTLWYHSQVRENSCVTTTSFGPAKSRRIGKGWEPHGDFAELDDSEARASYSSPRQWDCRALRTNGRVVRRGYFPTRVSNTKSRANWPGESFIGWWHVRVFLGTR